MTFSDTAKVRPPIVRKLNTGFLISFIILLITVSLSYYSLNLLLRRTEWVNHTNEVLIKLENIISLLKDAETGQRGYLLTQKPEFLEPYIGSYHKVFENFNEVKNLTIDNNMQQVRLDTLRELINQRYNFINKAIELQRSGLKDSALSILRENDGKRIMDNIRQLIKRMKAEELHLRKGRLEAVRGSTIYTPIFILIFAVVSLIISIVLYVILKKDIKKRVALEGDLADAYRHLEQSYDELQTREDQLRELNLQLEEKVEGRTEELRKRGKELQSSNEDLDSFVYAASHDLKAPIANLEGLVNALKEDVAKHCSAEVYEMLHLMENSSEKLKSIINDLESVSLARESGINDVENIHIDEIITSFRIQHGELIEETGAVIRSELLISHIRFSRSKLNTLINNLLMNALTYRSQSRSPEIRIRSELSGEYTLLTITDNGIGFSQSQKLKIFGMFKKAHTFSKGSGIGLYIVKRIVENNEGKIEVDSIVDAGTSFKIYLRNL